MTSLVLPDSLSCALSMSSSMPSKPAATPTSEAAGRSALLGGGVSVVHLREGPGGASSVCHGGLRWQMQCKASKGVQLDYYTSGDTCPAGDAGISTVGNMHCTCSYSYMLLVRPVRLPTVSLFCLSFLLVAHLLIPLPVTPSRPFA